MEILKKNLSLESYSNFNISYIDEYAKPQHIFFFLLLVSHCKIRTKQSHPALNMILLTDNLAFDSSILVNSNETELASLVNDGNLTSCVAIRGSEIWVQVDLKAVTIVTEMYITLIGML